MELQGEDVQPRTGEQRLQPRGSESRCARAAHAVRYPHRADDRAVDEQICIEPSKQPERNGGCVSLTPNAEITAAVQSTSAIMAANSNTACAARNRARNDRQRHATATEPRRKSRTRR